MCASCGCDSVNDVIIPGNKSGLGSGTSGQIKKQEVMHRDSAEEKGEGRKHERTESKQERIREYGRA